jgi:predicted transcriptional regulator
MAEQDSAPVLDPYRVARIVGSYVRHHQIEPGQLIRLIVEVHRAPRAARSLVLPPEQEDQQSSWARHKVCHASQRPLKRIMALACPAIRGKTFS